MNQETRKPGSKHGEDFDLGLAILHAITPRGVRRSHAEIAAFCGCKRSLIQYYEQRALLKLRKQLILRRDPKLLELVESVVGHLPGFLASKLNSP